MSRNLYKASWVVVSNDDKCVIENGASKMNERIEHWEAVRKARESAPVGYGDSPAEDGEFVGGLDTENVDALLADGDESGNVIKAAAAEEDVPDLEDVKAQAEEILQEAQEQAETIKEAAQEEIEALRKKTLTESEQQGYDAGYQRGLAEVDEMKQELAAEKARLEAEYDELIEGLEPRFIDTISGVYAHVFGIDLYDNRDILVHLIDSTLRRVESSRTFIVHVSAEDYPHVNMQKQTLLDAAGGRGIIEIIEDVALEKGACLIETDGGIFDCGINTQLEELTKKLQVLSFDGSSNQL